jgi:hypothetical protein
VTGPAGAFRIARPGASARARRPAGAATVVWVQRVVPRYGVCPAPPMAGLTHGPMLFGPSPPNVGRLDSMNALRSPLGSALAALVSIGYIDA